MKKLYIEPKIKQIALDPDQAILQVCRAYQGVWQNTTIGACVYDFSARTTGNYNCQNGAKSTARIQGDFLATDDSPGS